MIDAVNEEEKQYCREVGAFLSVSYFYNFLYDIILKDSKGESKLDKAMTEFEDRIRLNNPSHNGFRDVDKQYCILFSPNGEVHNTLLDHNSDNIQIIKITDNQGCAVQLQLANGRTAHLPVYLCNNRMMMFEFTSADSILSKLNVFHTYLRDDCCSHQADSDNPYYSHTVSMRELIHSSFLNSLRTLFSETESKTPNVSFVSLNLTTINGSTDVWHQIEEHLNLQDRNRLTQNPELLLFESFPIISRNVFAEAMATFYLEGYLKLILSSKEFKENYLGDKKMFIVFPKSGNTSQCPVNLTDKREFKFHATCAGNSSRLYTCYSYTVSMNNNRCGRVNLEIPSCLNFISKILSVDADRYFTSSCLYAFTEIKQSNTADLSFSVGKKLQALIEKDCLYERFEVFLWDDNDSLCSLPGFLT